METEKNEQFSIKFKPSLMKKIENYIEVVNANKEPSEKKLNKATFFNKIVTDYFEGIILTNDFIELEEPYYFNIQELIKTGTTKATTEKPSSNLKEQIVLFKVPNNLDVWDNKLKTYCTEKIIHEGIFSYIDVVLDSEGTETNIISYFIFKYNLKGLIPSNRYYNDFKRNFELTINYIPSEDLELFLNQYEENLAEGLLNDFQNLEQAIIKDRTEEGLTAIEVYKKYNDFNVLRKLSLNQELNNTGKLFSNIFNTVMNNIIKAKSDLKDISEELNEKKEHENITLADVENWENILNEDKLQIVNSLLKPNLSSKDSKTAEKMLEIFEENPDNPITNLIDSTINYLEEVNSSEEPVPEEEVLKNIFSILAETGFSVKENSYTNKLEVSNLLKENNINPVLLDSLNIFYDSDNVEDYLEGVNKLHDKLKQ